MKKIALINGVNLDRLGKREPQIYGTETLPELVASLKAEAEKVLTNVVNTIPGDFMTEKRSHYLQKLSPETQDTMRWKIAQTIMKLDNESK